MPREIKFRAWDGVFMDDDPVVGRQSSCTHEYIELGIDYRTNTINALAKTILSSVFTNGLVWMQFTGLLDRNGKEIYEGDIMKIGTGDLQGNKQVVFFNGKFVLMELHWKKRIEELKESLKDEFILRQAVACTTNLCDNLHLGIIGNIHENPELINKD